MLVESELVTAELGEFDTGSFVINFKDSDNDLDFLVLTGLVFADHPKLNLILIPTHLGLSPRLLQLLTNSLLDHIWAIGGEEFGIGGEQLFIGLHLLGGRHIVHLVFFNLDATRSHDFLSGIHSFCFLK